MIFREPRTTQERRDASLPEMREFIRNKRSFRNLPQAYDDIQSRRPRRSWKTFRNKQRRG